MERDRFICLIAPSHASLHGWRITNDDSNAPDTDALPAADAPRISVILPVYNAELFLGDALSSILGQTESSLEVLAVDDGSTDGSLAILRKTAQRDPRLLVFSHANAGLSATRNFALDRARGKWVVFVDSDDWIRPQMLENWLQIAERDGLELLIGNGFNFAKNPEAISDPAPILKAQPWGRILSGTEWILHCVAVEEWPHFAWVQLASRELIERNRSRFMEGIVHEDIPWTTGLGLVAKRIGFFAMPLYGYRKNVSSITRLASPASIYRRASSYLQIMAKIAALADEQPRLLSDALLRHLNREGGHFMGLLRKGVKDPATRKELSRDFFKRGLHRSMFQGAANGSEYWRALRCTLVAARNAL